MTGDNEEIKKTDQDTLDGHDKNLQAQMDVGHEVDDGMGVADDGLEYCGWELKAEFKDKVSRDTMTRARQESAGREGRA